MDILSRDDNRICADHVRQTRRSISIIIYQSKDYIDGEMLRFESDTFARSLNF